MLTQRLGETGSHSNGNEYLSRCFYVPLTTWCQMIEELKRSRQETPAEAFVAPPVSRDSLRNLAVGQTIIVAGGKRSGKANTFSGALRVTSVAGALKMKVSQHMVLLVDPTTHSTVPAIIIYRME